MYSTKYFGEIDLDNVEQYYEGVIKLSERPIEVSINIGAAKSLTENSVKAIDSYVDNIVTNEQNIRQTIQSNFKDQGEAKNYINFLLTDHDEDDLVSLTEDNTEDLGLEEKLLSTLYLLRISFYPEEADKVFAVYDYTIDEDLTNDLLVVIVSKDGKVKITIES